MVFAALKVFFPFFFSSLFSDFLFKFLSINLYNFFKSSLLFVTIPFSYFSLIWYHIFRRNRLRYHHSPFLNNGSIEITNSLRIVCFVLFFFFFVCFDICACFVLYLFMDFFKDLF